MFTHRASPGDRTPAERKDEAGRNRARRYRSIGALVVCTLVFALSAVLSPAAEAAGDKCAESWGAGYPLAWCAMDGRIANWAARGPHYDEYDGSTVWGKLHLRKYRPDCSGLVDMAWHLNADPNTDGLTSSRYTTRIGRGHLRAGDILDDTSDGHVVIFAGWHSDHYHFAIWSFGYGVFRNDAGHHERYDSFAKGGYIAGWPQSHYIALRYKKRIG